MRKLKRRSILTPDKKSDALKNFQRVIKKKCRVGDMALMGFHSYAIFSGLERTKTTGYDMALKSLPGSDLQIIGSSFWSSTERMNKGVSLNK